MGGGVYKIATISVLCVPLVGLDSSASYSPYSGARSCTRREIARPPCPGYRKAAVTRHLKSSPKNCLFYTILGHLRPFSRLLGCSVCAQTSMNIIFTQMGLNFLFVRQRGRYVAKMVGDHVFGDVIINWAKKTVVEEPCSSTTIFHTQTHWKSAPELFCVTEFFPFLGHFRPF